MPHQHLNDKKAMSILKIFLFYFYQNQFIFSSFYLSSTLSLSLSLQIGYTVIILIISKPSQTRSHNSFVCHYIASKGKRNFTSKDKKEKKAARILSPRQFCMLLLFFDK